MFRRDTYFHQLERVIDHATLQECKNFINKVRECRHKKVLDRQKRKFDALVQRKTNGHSNQDVQKSRKKMVTMKVKTKIEKIERKGRSGWLTYLIHH